LPPDLPSVSGLRNSFYDGAHLAPRETRVRKRRTDCECQQPTDTRDVGVAEEADVNRRRRTPIQVEAVRSALL
jgi:hypothetical protein